jgi:cell division protein FtsL
MSKAFEDSYAKLKSVFTSSGSREEEEDEEALQEQQEDNENSFVKTVRRVVKLNWKERVIGFAICIAISAFFVIVVSYYLQTLTLYNNLTIIRVVHWPV